PSQEPERHRDALDHLQERLEGAGLGCRRHPSRRSLVGRMRGAPVQLLVGHLDTVWPVGTLEHFPVQRHGDRLSGPGVFDMKAGLVQLVFALEALRELRLTPVVSPVVVINCDEEIGSPRSTPLLARLGRTAVRAFVLEPALGTSLKTSRKGGGRFRVHIQGVPAHAGLNPDRGASAILELSYVIQDLFALNDAERGVTVNVGVVDGGLRPNVVAPHSTADVDVRVPTQREAQRVEQAIRSLRPRVPGVRLKVEGGWGRPPMEATPRNQALFERARALGAELGLDLTGAAAGGSSDGNTLSQHTATLDGLGAVGDGAHSHEEYCLLEPMPVRAALLALLMLEPA
ncbi:MAG: M20 family metallopeptidase, partial [Candidatus Eremiobacterota bacterium]